MDKDVSCRKTSINPHVSNNHSSWVPYNPIPEKCPSVEKSPKKVHPIECSSFQRKGEDWEPFVHATEKHWNRADELKKQKRIFEREKMRIRQNAIKSSQVKRIFEREKMRIRQNAIKS